MPVKLGRDLAIHDVLVVMNREHRITSFEPYAGPLDLPAGTRIATSTRPDGRAWAITVVPFDRFDVVEAPVPTVRVAARLTLDEAGRPVLDVAMDAPASAAAALTAELRRVGDLLERALAAGREPAALTEGLDALLVPSHETLASRVARA